MRVALLADGGDGTFGGSDTYVEHLAKALFEKGCEVGIAILHDGKTARELRQRCSGVGEIVIAPTSIKAPWSLLSGKARGNGNPNFISWLEILNKQRFLNRWIAGFKPQVGHVHWAGGITFSRMAARSLLNNRVPVIETLHSHPLGSGRFLKLYDRLRMRYGSIVAVSRATQEQFWALYKKNPPHCEVIHCGVDREKLQEMATRARLDETGVEPELRTANETTILAVGHLNHQKGGHVLVEAAHELQRQKIPFRIWFLGDGPMRQELSQQIQDLGLTDQVKIAGFVRNIAPWYLQADILAQCSIRSEGIPLVVCEAMAFGLPVVGSRIGGIPEAVRDGETGSVVEPASPAALAASLRRLIEDDEFRIKLGARGARVCREEFDFSRSADRYLKLYSDFA